MKKGVDGISVLEALAATGLRAIRYAKEIADIGQVVANDMDAGAVASIRRNVAFNETDSKVTAHESDARVTMLTHQQVCSNLERCPDFHEGVHTCCARTATVLTATGSLELFRQQRVQGFHVVDLDPYGSPNTLLDAGVQCVAENGLLCVTATDMAVLCGNTAEACYAKYGAYSLHKDYCHEQALRILLATLSQHAARHKRVIEPVLCMAIDFYVRLFVRVRTSPADAKHTASKLSYVWQSTGCASWWLQPVGTASSETPPRFQPGRGPAVPDKCPISGGRFSMGGPIWHGPLHDMKAVQQLYSQIEANKSAYPSQAKLLGLLRAVQEELPDVPLYYTTAGLCRTLRCQNPKADHLHGAIVSAGYRASATHCIKDGLKTDAPPEVIWDIMRCWVRQHPVSGNKQDAYSKHILSQDPKLEAVFSRPKSALSKSKADKVARFVNNPENWGPRPRHGRPLLAHEEEQPLQTNGNHAQDTDKSALIAEAHLPAALAAHSAEDGADTAASAKRQKVV